MSVGVPKLAIFRIETMLFLIFLMNVQHELNASLEQTNKGELAAQAGLAKPELLKKHLCRNVLGKKGRVLT